MEAVLDLGAARRYLASRQCRDGGFCFYRNEDLEEPNLSDTWHALAAYHLLGATSPRQERAGAWLTRFDPASMGPDALHFWAFSRRLLNRDWQPGDATLGRIAKLELAMPNQDRDFSGWLSGAVHTARLQAAFGRLEAEPAVAAYLRRWHRGGYGLKPNLLDTAQALELLAHLGEADHGEETTGFVDALQDAGLGFRDTLDSSLAGLGVLLAGVRCCARLGLPLRHADAIQATLREAQYAGGACADVPGALPNLDSHYTALALDHALAETARPGAKRPGKPC